MQIIRTIRTAVTLALLGVGSALVPTAAVAQGIDVGITSPSAVGAVSALPAGPVLATSGIRNVVQTSSATVAEPPKFQEMGNGRNVALMIVGGAGIIVGSMVGGDGGQIITITGAVIGLVGLYRFLR